MDKGTGGIIGTIASIIAALLILYVLLDIYIRGLDYIFNPPTLYVMIGLIITGLFALVGYWDYTEAAGWRMRHLSPIALSLGALGVALGYMHGPMIGGSLIVLAYIIELFVGVKLYKDFETISPTGSKLFLTGVVVFMVFLPLILVLQSLALVSAAGDFVKTLGLILVLRDIIAQGS